jgi:stage V sporulation protein R
MSSHRKQQRAQELAPIIEQAREIAEEAGLSPRACKFWVIDHEEMNQLISYNGFQHRYPHWRWGMTYERQAIIDRYGLGMAYELVINDDPAHAYLQEQNSLLEQKAVIAHVMGHLDFFEKNPWFESDPSAAAMLERHGRRIKSFIENPEIGRERVEAWIEHILCLEDNIDQYFRIDRGECEDDLKPEITAKIERLGLSDDVREQIFNDEWLDHQEDLLKDTKSVELNKDILAYLLANGQQYDSESERAAPYEDWQREVLEMLREESYYFAPQKLTKVMNEGWAMFVESLIMTDEAFATTDEFVDFADHHAKILDDNNGQQLNPYTLGKELWAYVENTANREAVVECLLRVDGITPETFFGAVDFDEVYKLVTRPRHKDIAVRNFSLARPEHRDFIRGVTHGSLRDTYRYLDDTERYQTVAEALDDLDYTAGWSLMRDIRASHNDVTFIDEFLTEEFIRDEGYFTYDFDRTRAMYEITSRESHAVKEKLLRQFTNFGKPTVTVADGNYENKNELLLVHRYDGVKLNLPQATATLKHLYQLWGRPVNLYTVRKGDDDIEKPLHISFDGEELSTPDIKWEKIRPYLP